MIETNKIKAIILLIISGLLMYFFVLPFKTSSVDNVTEELGKLVIAHKNAEEQLSLKELRLKKKQLGTQETAILDNFIPEDLHSGYFVYNLGQIANQNRLNLKSIQYTVQDDSSSNTKGEQRLMVEYIMEGKYDDFNNWLRVIENSSTLIDVESFKATKNPNSVDTLTFYVKLFAYGINID